MGGLKKTSLSKQKIMKNLYGVGREQNSILGVMIRAMEKKLATLGVKSGVEFEIKGRESESTR